jgi:hypothetical protein
MNRLSGNPPETSRNKPQQVLGFFTNILLIKNSETRLARTYLQLPLQQWGAGNVYLLVWSSWKVNNGKNPIDVMGL